MTTQSRRRLLQALAAPAAAWTIPGLFAEALNKTVSLGEGPFYPDKMPLDTDNDLLVLNEGITPAVGDVAYISGRVLTANHFATAMSRSGRPTAMALTSTPAAVTPADTTPIFRAMAAS